MHADGVTALLAERAFVDLSAWRKVRVTGADSIGWLHDLLTADVAGLDPGQGVRSLLLTPTGRIRADVQVIRRGDDVVLLQDPSQPDHVGLLLHPYILSSDVALADVTTELAVIAVLGVAARLVGLPGSSPSFWGPGVDIVVGTGKPAWRLEDALVKAGLVEADAESTEAWRILRGHARMGRDFDQQSLPAEVGLGRTIDETKGCFLGQESVARVRHLGHPPYVFRHLRIEGAARARQVLLSGTNAVGELTSVAIDPTLDAVWTTCLGRVRWEAREVPLAIADGRRLADIPHSD